ncbi:MAG: phosphate/phosphite/phosphonate ABC transporter substrate-binding protein [Desulfobulbaceae bacterium]|nr:phosphate/phosphite/phosphonate ABC transporter substrate-binding protein [Desulfobulbaceae bacterium]
MKKIVFTTLSIIFLISSSAISASKQDNNKEYTMSIVPQVPSHIIQRDWKPFLNKLTQKTGFKFNLKFYKSIPDFEQGLLKGLPDFAYINPYHQVMALKEQGYKPLIRDNSKRLVGLLVVRKDNPIKSVKELNGKELAFPSPNALAASLYMRALLTESEKINFTAKYVKTHSNVYRNVLLKKTAAGGGVNKTLKKETKEFQDQLRILYKTPGIPPHPISAHPRVPDTVINKITAAILQLSEEKENSLLFKNIAIPNPIRANYELDYKPLELLGLEKYLEVK